MFDPLFIGTFATTTEVIYAMMDQGIYTSSSKEASGSALSHCHIVNLDGVQYLIRPESTAELEFFDLTKTLGKPAYASSSPSELGESSSGSPDLATRLSSTWLPVTAISIPGRLFSDGLHVPGTYLEDELRSMLGKDDVLINAFTQTVICLLPPNTSPASTLVSLECSKSREVRIAKNCEDNVLCSAPYFLQGTCLHKAYRMYPDPYSAFISGAMESESGE